MHKHSHKWNPKSILEGLLQHMFEQHLSDVVTRAVHIHAHSHKSVLVEEHIVHILSLWHTEQFYLTTVECLGSVCMGDSQVAKTGSQDRLQSTNIASLADQPEASSQIPFMDHWNVSRPHVSLRDIIEEEQALQKSVQKVTHGPAAFIVPWMSMSYFPIPCVLTSVWPSPFQSRQSRADLDRWDGATMLKEKQLYSLFPTIDRHFLLDIFRDHK